MARKTISMTIGTGIDEQLNALSEQYGLNKSSLVNRILQRTFACDHAIQNLMAVRPADRSRTIKRSCIPIFRWAPSSKRPSFS